MTAVCVCLEPAPIRACRHDRTAFSSLTPDRDTDLAKPAGRHDSMAPPKFYNAGLSHNTLIGTMEQVRISKLLAERGICSRREADSYIEHGWVLLDGKPVTELGTKAWPNQEITLARAAQSRQTARVTIILNKPVGYVSGQAEQGYRPAISLITAQSQYRGDDSRVKYSPTHLRGLAPAGRLDIDSQGLLVLTQDGRIARALIGEESDIDKEYL